MNRKKLWRQPLAWGLGAAVLLAGCGGKSADGMLADAKSHIEKQDSKSAVIELKNALQKQPSLAEARLLLGKLMVQSGEHVAGALELEKAKELGAKDEQVLPLLAEALLGQREYEKLIARLASTRLSDPSAQASLQVSLGTAYAATGKPEPAASAAKTALELRPGMAEALLLQARLAVQARDPAAALKLVEQAVVASPKLADAWRLKADLLMLDPQTRDAAWAAYQQALKLKPSDLGVRGILITTLVERKDLPAAKAELERLREAAPRHPLTAFYTGLLALEQGELERAHEHAEQALRAMPEDARALYLAGAVEFRRGRLELAATHLQQSLKHAPGQRGPRLMLAQVHLRSGEFSKVQAVLQPLLDAEETPAQAYALMAESLLHLGELSKAESFFAQAAKRDPLDGRSRTALALTQMARGSGEQGLEDLRAISASDTGVSADLALISNYLKVKDYASALKVVDTVERKQPGKAATPNLRARIELMRGDREAARRNFAAAQAIDAQFYPAVAGLAAMDLQDNKPQEAEARFAKLLEKDPKNLQARLGLVALKSSTGASKDELVEQLKRGIKDHPMEPSLRLALIRLEMQRGDPKVAQNYAREASIALPTSTEVLDALGQVLLGSGDLNQAMSTYKRLVALQSDSPVPYLRLAEVQMRSDDKAGAAQSVKKALAIRPDYMPALRAQFGLELMSGRFAEARQIAKSLQKSKPADPTAYVMEGDLEQAQKNVPVSATAYRAALAKGAGTEVAVKLHALLAGAGRAAEAEQFAAQWKSQQPKDASFLLYLADRALSVQNYAAAETAYQEVARLQPDSALALNNLAWLRNRAGQRDALELAEKANKLAPGRPAFMDTLAEVLVTQGQLAKAIDIQKSAVALAPDLHQHRLHLAKYYLAAGRKDEARAELNRLAGLGLKFPNHAEVSKLRASL